MSETHSQETEPEPHQIHERADKLVAQATDLSETLERIDKKLTEAIGGESADAS
jgi:hypothetical protein